MPIHSRPAHARLTGFRLALLPLAAAGALGLAAAAHAESAGSPGEIAAVMAAKTTATQAIQTAEAKSGGHAVAFGLQHDATGTLYDVTVAGTGGTSRILVDPTTGAITGGGAMRQGHQGQGRQGYQGSGGNGAQEGDAQAVIPPAGVKVSLSAAITAAEQAGKGKALDARYRMANGQPAVLVDVGSPTASTIVMVDATSAQILGQMPATAEQGGESGHEHGGLEGGSHERGGRGGNHEGDRSAN